MMRSVKPVLFDPYIRLYTVYHIHVYQSSLVDHCPLVTMAISVACVFIVVIIVKANSTGDW